ncbi:hypothetical protein HDK77DRAFT_487474 [Phyllosticta capitalensis]
MSVSAESMSSTSDPPPPGYPRLAERMGLKPQTAIFRRFAFLNKLNLLYLQAELVEIEDELRKRQIFDNQEDPSENAFARSWIKFRESADTENDGQFELVCRSSMMLEKYNTAMIQQSKILSMKFPDKMDIDDIRDFICSTEEMGHCNPFTGADALIWGMDEITRIRPPAPDIVTPYPNDRKDMFTNILNKRFFDLRLDKVCHHLEANGLKFWEEETLTRISFIFSTAIASILPIVSIIILYYVKPMGARFGLMIFFNILISTCLSFLTHAKRSEIFAVTAAFSAIQVVFVQSNNGPQTTST